jgi:hypothetical protein
VPTASKKIAFSAASLFFVTMNAVNRWKVVLTLIAIFVRPIAQQSDNELRNLYALNLREIDGILDRAQDRMNPILQPDQQQRLRQMVEERNNIWSNSSTCPSHTCREYER